MRHFLGPDLAQELASPLPNQGRPRVLKYSESDSSNHFPPSELSSGNDTTDSTGKTVQTSPCGPQPQRSSTMPRADHSLTPGDCKAVLAERMLVPAPAQQSKQEHHPDPGPKVATRQPHVHAPPPTVYQLMQQGLTYPQSTGTAEWECNEASTWHAPQGPAQHVEAMPHPAMFASQTMSEAPGQGPEGLYSHFGHLSMQDHQFNSPHAPTPQPQAPPPLNYERHSSLFSQHNPLQQLPGHNYLDSAVDFTYRPYPFEEQPYAPQFAGHPEPEYGLPTQHGRPMHLQQPGQHIQQQPWFQEQQHDNWQEMQHPNWQQQQPYPMGVPYKAISPGRPQPGKAAVVYNEVPLH